MFFSSIKEIDKLISKIMSHIYWNVNKKEKLAYSKVWFWNFCLQVSLWGAPAQADIIEF